MQPYDMFGGEENKPTPKKQKILMIVLSTLAILIFVGVILRIILVPTVKAEKDIKKAIQQEQVATEAYRRRH